MPPERRRARCPAPAEGLQSPRAPWRSTKIGRYCLLAGASGVAGHLEVADRTTIRTGFTPEGRQLNSKEMPWPTYSMMTDEELQAVWLFLQELPPQQSEK